MRIAIPVLAVLSLAPLAQAADWLTLPSRYTHNPSTGQRVSQYSKIQAPSVPQPSNFRTSGYTHTRSSLNYGQSADNYHRVEQWGDPVRPYGEWRFPYRPYSTPYPNWGPPYAGLNLGGGFYGPYGPMPYDPYRGAGFNPGDRYPRSAPRGPGSNPALNSGASAGPAGVPGNGTGDGMLPPVATMSIVPSRDGVGMPVTGTMPEGERVAPAGTPPASRPNAGSVADTSSSQAYVPGQRPVDHPWARGRYRPTPQPSPFNPYPSGPGTPYPVAPYYDGYYPVYRN